MLGFNHVLAGSIIAVITPAPLVPLIAFVSHYALDMVPHFGRSDTVYPYTKAFKAWLLADALLCFAALALATLLFPDKWFIIAVGAFFAALPDFFWLLRGRTSKIFERFLDWSEAIQWGERPYGWKLDVIYALLMAIALYLLSR